MAVKVKDDLTGRIFSNLSVVGRAPDRKNLPVFGWTIGIAHVLVAMSVKLGLIT